MFDKLQYIISDESRHIVEEKAEVSLTHLGAWLMRGWALYLGNL